MTDPASDVWHYAGLDYWDPVSPAKMEHLYGLLGLERGASVLDVGSGSGELLLRLVERYGVRATGVDKSPFALELARAAFAERAPAADVTLLECEVDDGFVPPGAPFDAVAWCGGPYIGGAPHTTVRALAGWVRPGGVLLVGQGFWAQPPPAEYLAATGLGLGELTDHPGNLEAAEAVGLRTLYCTVSTRDEWDVFEGTIRANSERYALAHPDNPDPRGRLESGRTWFSAQQRWGRDTMGFAHYVFLKPPDA